MNKIDEAWLILSEDLFAVTQLNLDDDEKEELVDLIAEIIWKL